MKTTAPKLLAEELRQCDTMLKNIDLERPLVLLDPSRYGETEARFRPRLYCRGEQPMTRLKAVLKALSDS